MIKSSSITCESYAVIQLFFVAQWHDEDPVLLSFPIYYVHFISHTQFAF